MSELIDKLKVLRLVQFEKEFGREPIKRFPERSRCSKELQELSILKPAIDPVRLL